ncbi:MAG TPA: multidrug resistance efflux transporter family protein [Bacillales bacterium]|nr:multidrug resistance efflux transporter family protein [Bacillales bacterium]
MRPIISGIFAAFFFAFTFILNRMMDLAGGSWIWSASLRYFFMIPFLVAIVLARKNLKPLLLEMKKQPWKWLLWSSIGFGLFYAPLCFSAAFAPGWLIASTWQITIISGSLLAPFFWETIMGERGQIRVRGSIPLKGISMSGIILIGIILMQIEQAKLLSFLDLTLGVVPVIIASFAYPLGNRKMMELCEGRLDTFQRVLGMTIASVPFWIILSGYGFIADGWPSTDQSIQSGIVAITSGVIATVLFFQATDLVRGNMQKLAAVEATQSMEVLFALIGELLLLKSSVPTPLSWFGIILVMAGMILHSLTSHKTKLPKKKQEIA